MGSGVSGFRVSGFGQQGLRFRVLGFGFRGLRFRVSGLADLPLAAALVGTLSSLEPSQKTRAIPWRLQKQKMFCGCPSTKLYKVVSRNRGHTM